ncbi:MAG TPA: site-2 protease family protein, partial [bacterium]|nr:site-2 protease family protein [bacterium]
HGSVAYSLGDPTAKYAGRLTLNPISHLDPFGSIILPILLLILTGGQGPIFGWAKPVPINPYNFKDPKWDNAKVGLAGPISNFSVALIFGAAIRFLPLPGFLLEFFSIIVVLNILLAVFNLIPIPPLDGSHILFAIFPERLQGLKMFLHEYGLFLLLFFIFFGLKIVFLITMILYNLITGYSFI